MSKTKFFLFEYIKGSSSLRNECAHDDDDCDDDDDVDDDDGDDDDDDEADAADDRDDDEEEDDKDEEMVMMMLMVMMMMMMMMMMMTMMMITMMRTMSMTMTKPMTMTMMTMRDENSNSRSSDIVLWMTFKMYISTCFFRPSPLRGSNRCQIKPKEQPSQTKATKQAKNKQTNNRDVFFRPTPLGFRQVVHHVQFACWIEPVN